MNKLKFIFIIAVAILISNTLPANTITQTVKGQVVEKQTLKTILGATVILLGTDPLILFCAKEKSRNFKRLINKLLVLEF